MSLAQESNKEIALTLHTAFKSKGHTLPLGHVYEALSQLAGHKNWNVAKAKDVDFSKYLTKENKSTDQESTTDALKRHTDELIQMMGTATTETVVKKVAKSKTKEVSLASLKKKKDKIYTEFGHVLAMLDDDDVNRLGRIGEKATKLRLQIMSNRISNEELDYAMVCLQEIESFVDFFFNFTDS